MTRHTIKLPSKELKEILEGNRNFIIYKSSIQINTEDILIFTENSSLYTERNKFNGVVNHVVHDHPALEKGYVIFSFTLTFSII